MSPLDIFHRETGNVFKECINRFSQIEQSSWDVVFKNRKRLLKEYKLTKKHISLSLRQLVLKTAHDIEGSSVDHVEFYKNAEGKIVFISSNYDGSFPPAFGLLMRPIYPIYSIHAQSWIVVWDSYKDARFFLGNAKSINAAILDCSPSAKSLQPKPLTASR